MSAAVDALRAGRCIGIFPEGTLSRGEALRPFSGAGRLALAVPEARLVCVAASGVVDIVRFPRRPRLRVQFFEPATGQPQEGESAVRVTKRIMAEIREAAPYAAAGRRRRPAGPSSA
jgi:1-acyl-sn-glycerol-3-phosphate acyltransferase